jgi:5S rRNA maturation endonuclease (ribonuclease M5)
VNGVDVVEKKAVKDGLESICDCPACGRKDKLSINTETLLYQCFVCHESGKAKSEEESGRAADIAPKEEFGEDTIHEYIKTLVDSCNINEYVRSYFLEKKIPIEFAERFHVGYNGNTPRYRDIGIAKSLKLVNSKGNSRFYNRIIFPVIINGKYVYATSRAVGSSSDAKWLDMSLRKRIFNNDVIDSAEKIFLCEGIPDTINMIAHGHETSVGILGSGVFKTEYAERLKGKHVVVCYDNDFSGRDSAKRVSRILRRESCVVESLSLPEDMDVSEFFASTDDSTLNIVSAAEVKDDDKDLLFSRSEPNLLHFRFSHYDIQVSDIIPRKGVLKAAITITNESKTVASSTIDLQSMRSRAIYAKEFTGIAKDIALNEAKSMLMDLANAVKQNLEEVKEESPQSKQYVMSEIEKEYAINLLSDDKLLYRIKVALDRNELVGENINKLLLYLIYTSRLMKKPISCIIKGLSSSGKTYMMGKVLTLIPPESYITLQQATARSFYYMGENDLKHKMIIIGEMAGAEASEYSLREAQDGIGEGDLIIATVEKDPDSNQMQTTIRRVSGPCGFVSSTTDVEINPENETRNFSIYVRIDEKKVKETTSPLINKYTRKSKILSQDESLLFHNAQRCLQTKVNVEIPYIQYVLDKFPLSPIRVMRDRVRFCTLLETITIMHQFQRKMDVDDNGDKWVTSSISDYNIALILMDEILLETIYELPKKSREIYATAQTMRDEMVENITDSFVSPERTKEMFYTTYKKIAERIKMKSADVRRWSKPLFESGYFDYYESGEDRGKGGRGKETKLVPIDKDFYQTFLPSPDELANFCGVLDETLYNPLTGEERKIERIEVEL